DLEAADGECCEGRDEERDHSGRDCYHKRIAHLLPEEVEVVVLLLQHDGKIVQRRVIRPEIAREGGILRRDGEQYHVIDWQNRPQKDRNANQQQLTPRRDSAGIHFDNRFIMKKTSGSTSGNAATMAAIERSTLSSRR